MSDPATPDPDAPDEEPPEEFDAERAKAKIAKANSEAANLRKRLKDAEAKAARLDELEAADKSEADKLRDQLAEAQRTAQEAELRAMRSEVAASKGLTAAQAKRLQGSSPEELEADADELLTSFAPPEGTPGPPPQNRQERLRGGSDPTTDTDVDVKSLVESIPPT